MWPLTITCWVSRRTAACIAQSAMPVWCAHGRGASEYYRRLLGAQTRAYIGVVRDAFLRERDA